MSFLSTFGQKKDFASLSSSDFSLENYEVNKCIKFNKYDKNKSLKKLKSDMVERKIEKIIKSFKIFEHLLNFFETIIYFIGFSLILFILQDFPKCNNLRLTNPILSNAYEVKLKVVGTGNKKILYENYFCPSNIYINRIKKTFSNCHYIDLTEEGSLITLQWENIIRTTIGMFYSCEDIIEIDMTNFDTSLVTDMSYMFFNCVSLETLDISNFNTINVETMEYMFSFCSNLISINLQSFITSKVTTFSAMFAECTSLKSIIINNFQTELVIDMSYMFYYCTSLETLDISSFNTKNVGSMYYMFAYCMSLKSINLQNFDTSKVTTFDNMFTYCLALEILDISNFNTTNVKTMEFMFSYCIKLNSINLQSFDTSNVTIFYGMFFACISLTTLNLNNFQTGSANNMTYMFSYCDSLELLDISNFNTINVITMEYMFLASSNLKSINLQNLDTSNVKTFYGMFGGCSSLTSINLTNFKTDSAIDLSLMFYQCSSLEILDLSNFNTINVITMEGMFIYCSNLRSINLQSFNTLNVEVFGLMFDGCSSLTSINLTHFKTDLATDMSYMFNDCKLLEIVDISNFNTINVTNMELMFSDCINLKSINLKSFDTSNVITFDYMFFRCISLTSINLSNFLTLSAISMLGFFYNCTNLEYINLQNFEENENSNITDIFFGIKENAVICINKDKNPKISSLITDEYTNMVISCEKNWRRIRKKLDISSREYVDNCNSTSFTSNKLEYEGICINKCPNDTKLYESICYSKCDLDKCDICSYESELKNLCISCNDNYFQKLNDINNKGEMINCYNKNSIEKFYGDENDNFFKPCFNTCKTCDKNGTYKIHNCITCDINYLFNISKEDYYNCYPKCDNYMIIDIDGNYICINNTLCPIEYPYLIVDINQCIDYCSLSDMINKLCILNNKNDTIIYGQMIENIKYELINGIFNISDIYNGENIIIEIKNSDVEINKSKLNLDFEECENKLRNIYNIPQNESLLIFKYEEKDSNISNVVILIYYKFENNIGLTQLNLSYCRDTKFECQNYYYMNKDGNYICLNNTKCPQKYPYLILSTNECVNNCTEFGFNQTLCELNYVDENNYNEINDSIINYNEQTSENITQNLEDNNFKKSTFIILFENNCENLYYLDPFGNYICINGTRCPQKYPYLILSRKECVNNCSFSNKKLCIINYINQNDNKTYDIMAKFQEEIIENIRQELINGEFDGTEIANGTRIIIENEDSKIELYENGIQNFDSLKKSNLSNLDLGKCEDELKNIYNISKNDSFLILKLDAKIKNLNILKVEYELYYKFENNIEYTKINLDYCKNININLALPFYSDKSINIDQLNPDSSYYNDICYQFTSENNADITLNLRRKEYNNIARCEPNCQAKEIKIEKIYCSCEIKTNFENKIGSNIDTKLLLKKFKDIKNIFNIQVLKCIKLIFSFKKNYGNIISLAILIIYLIILIIFKIKSYYEIINYRDTIIYIKLNINRINLILNNNKKISNEDNNKDNISKKNDNNNNINNIINNNNNLDNENKQKEKSKTEKLINLNKNIGNKIFKKKGRNIFRKRTKANPPKGKGVRKKIKSNTFSMNSVRINLNKSNDLGINETKNDLFKNILIKFNKLSDDKIYEIYNKLYTKTDLELNELSYEDAIKLDKRIFLEYYLSLVRTKHLIFFSFGKKFDFNSKVIKILLFFFFFNTNFFINALFFTDESMNKIYYEGGTFDFLYNLPQILYSTIITIAINVIIKLLALTEKKFIEFRNDTTEGSLLEQSQKLIKFLKIKFVTFFILDFIFIIIFWLYLACFCAVYVNTQIHLIKDTISSFAISLIYPFGVYVLPGIFRIQ